MWVKLGVGEEEEGLHIYICMTGIDESMRSAVAKVHKGECDDGRTECSLELSCDEELT